MTLNGQQIFDAEGGGEKMEKENVEVMLEKERDRSEFQHYDGYSVSVHDVITTILYPALISQ